MKTSDWISNWKKPLTWQPPPEEFKTSARLLSFFNMAGMSVEYLIIRKTPEVSPQPVFLSVAVGLFSLLFLMSHRSSRKLSAKTIFLLNFFVMTFGVTHIYSHFGVVTENWAPFQGTKLACLMLGMVAPTFFIGAFAICFLSGVATFQILAFDDAIRTRLSSAEPWAVIGFALTGLFILFYRVRIREMLAELNEAAANAKVTLAHLRVKDGMNTPLQAIELGLTAIQKDPAQIPTILPRLERSLEQLRELNSLLSQTESDLAWKAWRARDK